MISTFHLQRLQGYCHRSFCFIKAAWPKICKMSVFVISLYVNTYLKFHTFSLDKTPLCSNAHIEDTAVVRMAPATRPACHTQLGMMMSFTTVAAKSANFCLESRVVAALITRRDRREKNFSLISGSLSAFRLVTRIGIMRSKRSPTTGPKIKKYKVS